MLESLPSDIFSLICQYLNFHDVKSLIFVSKKIQNSIIKDDTFWTHEFKRNFPHCVFVKDASEDGAYKAFKKCFIDEYRFNLNTYNGISPSRIAALFTAAKIGDSIKFQKLYDEILKDLSQNAGKKVHILEISDNSGWLCYHWLCLNGHQNILDNVYSTTVKTNIEETLLPDDRFKLAVLCNQKTYLKENATSITILTKPLIKFTFLSAVKIGAEDTVKFLLEKLAILEADIHEAFRDIAKYGYTDHHTNVIECLHQQIAQYIFTSQLQKKIAQYTFTPELQEEIADAKTEKIGNFHATRIKIYKDIMYRALKTAMDYQHKDIVKKLLTIYQKNYFYFCNSQGNSLFEDPLYANMMLELGVDPNYAHEFKKITYSPIEFAIYHGHYETLIILLQKGAKFHSENFLRIKDWVNGSNHYQSWLAPSADTHISKLPRPTTSFEKLPPDMQALIKLMLYKQELEAEPTTTLLSFDSNNVFHVENPQEVTIKRNACNVLFDVILRKRSTSALDEIDPVMLKDEKNPLASIYQGLSGEIEKVRMEEVASKTHQPMSLDGIS